MKNIIIAGGGDVGYHLAKTLSEEGHRITIIERLEEVTEKLEALDILVVTGNAASPSVLQKAYISSADMFIAVTGIDEVNMAACAVAKNRGCRTMARINSADYIEKPVTTEDLKDAGIDLAFCPELISSEHMANILKIPLMLDSPLFLKEKVRVLEVRVDKNSKAAGKELRKISYPTDVNLVCIFRNENVIIPRGNERLQPNDRVIAVASSESSEGSFNVLSRMLGVPLRADFKKPIEKVMIAGASRIGYHMARLLSERNMSVLMIDENEARCREMSEKLPDVLVINGQPTDKELLKEEGISETDAFLAVTEKEEVNILTSLLARQYGATRSIALVDKPGLRSVLEEVGIDLVISPRSATLSTILKYFHQDDFESVGTLGHADVQVIDIRVRERSKAANRRLDSIMRFRKRDMLVGAIVRGSNVIIPHGDTFIHPKDRLLIFTKSNTLKWVKDYF